MKRNSGDSIFEGYSLRTRQIIFIARLKAGQRGAPEISIDDLLAAVIVEDQQMKFSVEGFPEFESVQDSNSASWFIPHASFFDSQTAAALLERIDSRLEIAAPQPDHLDIPVSAGLSHAFEIASRLAEELRQSKVEPLVLLASVLGERSSNGVELFREFGFTQAKVLEEIRNSG